MDRKQSVPTFFAVKKKETTLSMGTYYFTGTAPFTSLPLAISRRRRKLGFPLALPPFCEKQQYMKARLLWDSFHSSNISGLAVFVKKLVLSCSLSSTGRKARPFFSLLRSSGFGGNVSPVLVPFPF